jgi:hypothetical protein
MDRRQNLFDEKLHCLDQINPDWNLKLNALREFVKIAVGFLEPQRARNTVVKSNAVSKARIDDSLHLEPMKQKRGASV